MDATKTQALLKELELTRTGLVDTWKVYMTWFTFFFTTNLLVMSWIYTRPLPEVGSGTPAVPFAPGSIRLLSAFWIFFNATGIATSIWLAWYSRTTDLRIRRTLKKLSGAGLTETQPALPLGLGMFGALANAVSLGANALAWHYIVLTSVSLIHHNAPIARVYTRSPIVGS